MCENFVNNFVEKITRINTCKHCIKRHKVCKNTEHYYNHLNPKIAIVMLRQYMGDEDDIDTVLTILHTDKKLPPFVAERLYDFIHDMEDDKYIFDAIKKHLVCLNDDFLPYFELSDDGNIKYICYFPTDKTITFNEWMLLKFSNENNTN